MTQLDVTPQDLTVVDDDITEHDTTGTTNDATAVDRPGTTGTDRRWPKRPIAWSRLVAFGVLPGAALTLTLGAAYLKYQDDSNRRTDAARVESVQAATQNTIKMLSYRADNVAQDLESAKDNLTGEFRDSYTSLIHDVVIPGARQKQISAVATVPAASPVSVAPDRAVVLVYVNQSIIMGAEPPTSTASSVRVTLDQVDGRWLTSEFDPV